jgi:hypothetical protein
VGGGGGLINSKFGKSFEPESHCRGPHKSPAPHAWGCQDRLPWATPAHRSHNSPRHHPESSSPPESPLPAWSSGQERKFKTEANQIRLQGLPFLLISYFHCRHLESAHIADSQSVGHQALVTFCGCWLDVHAGLQVLSGVTSKTSCDFHLHSRCDRSFASSVQSLVVLEQGVESGPPVLFFSPLVLKSVKLNPKWKEGQVTSGVVHPAGGCDRCLRAVPLVIAAPVRAVLSTKVALRCAVSPTGSACSHTSVWC